MRWLSCSAFTLALALAPLAAAQDYEAMASRMEQSMADAQAAAQRPGDEALGCDQLETEMVTTMQDPQVQAVLAEQGAQSQEQMARMREAQGRVRAQIATSMFMGIASSFIPGLGYAQMAQQQAQAAQMQQQQQAHMGEMMQMAERMQTIMPQMMRGQRVHELAQAKQCAFVQAQQQ
ncbi:hypothetical protein [Terricaulis sp.]|uniref:hypothetical protein n=1 Tax=Terricaulis sp. TaxID=2768686 RepID=UPI0037846010